MGGGGYRATCGDPGDRVGWGGHVWGSGSVRPSRGTRLLTSLTRPLVLSDPSVSSPWNVGETKEPKKFLYICVSLQEEGYRRDGTLGRRVGVVNGTPKEGLSS